MNTEEENKTSNPSSKIKNEIECTIGSICSRFSSGKGITAEKISPTGEYPVYGGNGVRGYTDNYNFEGQCVVIGRQGANCGNVKYFEGKAYMSEHAIVGVTHQEHDNRYFAYKLSMLNLGRFSGQAAQPGLSVAKLKTLKMTMPNFNIQYRIASILSAYDHLIENNTRRIRLLEQMAENLYKEWFVRFRFPEHEKVEMVNGLPKGWKIKKVSNVCETMGGGTPTTTNPAYWGGDIKWVTPSDITSKNSLALLKVKGRITEEGLKKSSAKLLPPYTILMTSRASIGFFGICPDSVCTNQGFISIIPNKETFRMYLLYTFKSRKEEIISNANGSTFLEISKGRFRKMKVLVPPEDILDSFEKKTLLMFKVVLHLEYQNQLLTHQRDLLLPRLMSGKLEVKS